MQQPNRSWPPTVVKEFSMLPLSRSVPRTVVAAVGAAAIAAATSIATIAAVGTAAIAAAISIGAATPAMAEPPNCTAADLAGVSAGVSQATSDYLFAHPDVNAYFSGLKGRPTSQIRNDVENYLSGNPQVKADLQGIRQPLIDLRNRCQVNQ
jgi:hemophore-related protein